MTKSDPWGGGGLGAFLSFWIPWALLPALLVSCTQVSTELPSCEVHCPETAAAALALEWVEAVERQDWEAMAELLDPDAVYEDRTMRHYDRDPIHLRGPTAIAEFWRVASEDSGASDIRYHLERCFETGGVVVLGMTLSLGVSGEFWGVAVEQIQLSGLQTTVVTVEGDKIVHVIDHVDYAGADRQIEELRRIHGSTDR